MIEGRLGWNEYFMNIAVQVSLRSTCVRRKVGAILVKDNTIISTGYNGAPKGLMNCSSEPGRCYRNKHNIPSGEKLDMCYAQHAEVNALLNAMKSGVELKGASIYVTTFPCSTCAKALIQVGISNIYYLDEYTNEFTLSMLEEAGVKTTSMDSSIYRTPEVPGGEVKATNDLDTIDPLVAQIYKYEPGTEDFKINRDRIFRENNLYSRYDELILATEWQPKNGMTSIQHHIIGSTEDKKIWTPQEWKPISNVIKPFAAKRYDLEYNGAKIKQFVVAAFIMNMNEAEVLLLESITGRLKGKYTMVQGHASIDNPTPDAHVINILKVLDENMFKEIEEEIGITQYSGLGIGTLDFFIQLNDNKISEEHIGAIYKFTADFDELERLGWRSAEPEKHRLVRMPIKDLKTPEVYNRLDTWLKAVVDLMIVDK